MESKVVYKRILLKISGEALAGEDKTGINKEMLDKISTVVKEAVDLGVQLAIVIGGGNFWRGRDGADMDRVRSDQMGMLSTVINALAIQDAFEHHGIKAKVMTALSMPQIAEPFIQSRAVELMERGYVMIFGCGLGSPFFSTDTAASIRAAEIGADALLLAKNVSYVYTDDPKKNPEAKILKEVTFDEILAKRLGVMDLTAATFSMDRKMPILLFGIDDPYNIIRVIKGERVGTIVKEA